MSNAREYHSEQAHLISSSRGTLKIKQNNVIIYFIYHKLFWNTTQGAMQKPRLTHLWGQKVLGQCKASQLFLHFLEKTGVFKILILISLPILQHIQPASQTQTICINASLGPPCAVSSSAWSFEDKSQTQISCIALGLFKQRVCNFHLWWHLGLWWSAKWILVYNVLLSLQTVCLTSWNPLPVPSASRWLWLWVWALFVM